MQAADNIIFPAPMAHSVQLWLERCTGFASRSGGRLVIEVVHNIHIHVGLCSKLFKGLECAVLSMVLCTIKNP